MALLTDQILATGVSLNDLIHIVITGDTSQNPAGSSYKATVQQVADAITGGTVTGTSGSSGTSGTSGSSGTSGNDGTSGSSGTSGGSNWGSFISTVDQTIGVAGTTYKMSADTTTGSSNITLSGGSRFVVSNAGVYNIQFSAQLNKTTATKSNVFIWLSKNGTAVPQSSTDVSLPGGSSERVVASWNWLDEATTPNTYYEIEWTGTLTNAFLDYDATPLYGPVIPSLIVTVTQV